MNGKRLYLSNTNKKLAGVCGGIAEFFGLEASRVRLAALVLMLFGGLSLWAYIILWIVMPKGPKRLNP